MSYPSSRKATLALLLLASAPLPGPPAVGAPETAVRGAGVAPAPLRVHPTNPRYFADRSGKAVFLTGSHTWANLQDITYDGATSPPTFDFPAYLTLPHGELASTKYCLANPGQEYLVYLPEGGE